MLFRSILDLLCFLCLARGAFNTSMQWSDVDAATWCSLTSENIVTQEEDTKALSKRSLTQPRSPSLLLHVKAAPIYPMSQRLQRFTASLKLLICPSGLKLPPTFSPKCNISLKSPMQSHGRLLLVLNSSNNLHDSSLLLVSGCP